LVCGFIDYAKKICSESSDLFKFGKITDNISKTVHDRYITTED